MPDWLALLTAILLAALGGDRFLKGVLGIAAALRLPNFLVASTFAAFATSSPELTVSILAALAGQPEIGLGDALGSNVVNLGLIMGLALLFGALHVRFAGIRRDFGAALGVPMLTGLLVLDGNLSGVDGAALLAVFGLWLALTVQQARLHRRATLPQPHEPLRFVRTALLLVAGATGLVLAGHLFVAGASGMAEFFGLHAYIIGATILAIGTSLPELVTILLARWRGHDDIGLGTLLGSNVFNGLAIVGTTAAIHPITIAFNEVAVALGFGVLVVLLIAPIAGSLSRLRGGICLMAYVVYATATVFMV